MQLQSLLLTLLLSSAVIAKGNNGNSTKAVTDKSLCREMSQLTKLVDLAANSTKLADKTNNNATKIAQIQAKASEASTKLTTMSTNSTLVTTCAAIASVEETEDHCDKIKSITKLMALVANTTALEAKTDGNATKADNLKAKAESAAVMLQELNSNATLVAACADIAAAKTARKQAKNNGTTTGAEKAAATSGTAAQATTSTVAATGDASFADPKFGVLMTGLLVVAGMMAL